MNANVHSPKSQLFKAYTLLRTWSAYLILTIGLISMYWLFVSPSSLNPTNITWLGETDLRQHYLGWYAYRVSEETGPLWGQTTLLNYPHGVPIVGTDSNPLYSFLLSPFVSFLPETFQFIGFSYLVNMTLALAVSYALLHRLNFDKITAALFAILLAFPPIFFWRFGHDTLTTQWLILAHFYVALNMNSAQRTIAAHGILLIFAILTHPYLFVMNFIIVGFDILSKVFSRYGLKWGTIERTIVAVLGSLIAALYVGKKSGVFSLQTKSLNEVGVFSTDIIALFNPFSTSSYLPNLPAADGQYEGYAYLGLGGIVLLLSVVVLAIKQSTDASMSFKTWRAIIFASIFGLILALGPALPFAGNALLDLELSDDGIVAKIMSKIRSHGRFIWIMNYAIILLAIAALPRSRPMTLRAAAVVLIGLQIIDLAPLREKTLERTAHAEPAENPYLSDEWGNRFESADFVYLSSQFTFDHLLDVAEGAFKKKTPVTRFYTAQGLGLPKQHEAAELLRIETLNGMLEPTALYLFDNEIELPIVHRQASDILHTENLGDHSAVLNSQFKPDYRGLNSDTDFTALTNLCLQDCSMVITTNGDVSKFLSANDRALFAAMDSKLAILNIDQNYAGVFRNGKPISEALTISDSAAVNAEEAGRFLSVTSASSTNNDPDISVNGTNYARLLPGISVALIFDNGNILTALLNTPRSLDGEVKNSDLLAQLAPELGFSGDAILDNYAITSTATPFLNLNRFLNEDSSLADVLAKCKAGCSMGISIKDEATAALPREVRILAGQMGLSLSEIEFRDGFAAIIEDGIVLVQARSHNDTIKIGETTRGRKIQVESAGFNAGSKSSLKLDDIELSLSKRGINLVVFNENQEITYHFDTHGS